MFDLDGTLIDTSEGIIRAIDYIETVCDLPILSEKTKCDFIGPPIEKSFYEHYGCTMERAWELASVWREVYKDKFLLNAKPYDGIYELLWYCHKQGMKTAVATNKREDYAIKLLEHFSFLPLFDCIVGSDFERKRTKTDIIRLCMKQMGVTIPGHCLMVGDTMYDVNGAQQAGIDFLGVTYGFGFKKDDIETSAFDTVDSCIQLKNQIIAWGTARTP